MASSDPSIDINEEWEEDQPLDEFPTADPNVLSQFVSKDVLLQSFYLHFFIIFLIPILNLIVLLPSPPGDDWPRLNVWLSLAVSALNSVLMFKSYDDIYHPLEYEEKKMIHISDLAQIFDGFTVYSFGVILVDIYFILHITPECWTSIMSFYHYLNNGSSTDQLNVDLVYLYSFELIRLILTLFALNYQKDIRSQTAQRNSYLWRKGRVLPEFRE